MNEPQPAPPSIEETTSCLQQLEKEHDLLKYEIGGWCAWPVIRLPVFLKLLNSHQSKSIYSARLRLWDRIVFLLQDIPTLISLPKSRYVVVVYAENLSEQKDHRYYTDIFFDELLLKTGNAFKLEHIHNPIYLQNRKAALIKSNMTSTFFVLAASVISRIGLPNEIYLIAQRLASHLNRELGAQAIQNLDIPQRLLKFYWMKILYKWFLQRIRPDSLWLVNAYGDHSLVAAAKECQIKVIEFQHGIIYPQHGGYSWPTYAVKYKDRMPIPDKIFLYGEYWKAQLEAYGFWGEALRVTGSLRLDQFRNRCSTQKNTQMKLILTTQNVIDPSQYIQFIKEFRQISVDGPPYTLYIKLHPGESNKEPYETAFQEDADIQILLNSEMPSTFELLSSADYHMSAYSTCHYEALAFGVQTIILPFKHYQVALGLYTQGYAFLAQTPQDLYDIILYKKKLTIPPEIGTYFFKPGALENILQELERA